eukprot:343462-Pyramimonas_sp.AAC.1
MSELSTCAACISLPGAGETSAFNFNRGGKQGGPDTPDLFDAVIEATVEPLAHEWTSAGCGFELERSGRRINHLIWAGNMAAR